jgi:superkiller protein 3
MLANREQYEEALEKFDQALDYDPKMINALHNKALTQQRLGRLNDAHETYAQLMELSPNNPRILSEVGVLKTYLEDLEGALEIFNQLIKINKATPNIYSNIGVVLLKLEKFDAAEEVLKDVLENNPDYDTARYNLATLYAIQRNYEDLENQLIILGEKMAVQDLVSRIKNDTDFREVRDTQEFENIIKKLS